MQFVYFLSFVWRRAGRAHKATDKRIPTSGALALIILLSPVPPVSADAFELPEPAALENQTGIPRQTLTVIEPHETSDTHRVEIAYTGLPMDALLTHWFGDRWRTPSAELVFQAADGYRSIIAASRLQSHRAVLAVARGDGRPFVVDNPAQHQTGVTLGPYYLVWDNLNSPTLQADGTHGWPYQVTRIELRTSADDLRLMPPNPPDDVKAGFVATKDHCLTCHRVRGVGGQKHPSELERSTCNWNDEKLAAFINDPGKLRPGSAMPPLQGVADVAVRERTIGHIVKYLRAIEAADQTCNTGASKP